jgi:hypothetical protein
MYRIDTRFYFLIQRIFQFFGNNYTSWTLSAKYNGIIDSKTLLSDLQRLLLTGNNKIIKCDTNFLCIFMWNKIMFNFRLDKEYFENTDAVDEKFFLHFYTSTIDIPTKSIPLQTRLYSDIFENIENLIKMDNRNLKTFEIAINYPNKSPYYVYWIKTLPEEEILKFNCLLKSRETDDKIVVDKNMIRLCSNSWTGLFRQIKTYLVVRGF